MKAYIVNLKSSLERRLYIKRLLQGYPSIQIEWIEAVDGRKLSNEKKEQLFDISQFQRHYLKEPRAGEIGCTLSHQQCYHTLLKSTEKSVLVFEDDIVLNANIEELIPEIEKFLNVDEPRVLLLSGWFWYKSKDNFNNEINVCKVFDGYLTHAYALNREAAELLIDIKPYFLADAWELFIKKGVKIYGLQPHPIDKDWSGVFKSEVLSGSTKKTDFYFSSWINLKVRGIKQRLYKYLNNFEAPQNMDGRVGDIKKSIKE